MKFYRYIILGIVTLIAATQTALCFAPSDYSLETGKYLYDLGKLREAATIWERASKEFELRQDWQHLTLSYNCLAIVYQDLGEWEKAKQTIAQAVKLSANLKEPLIKAQVLNVRASWEFHRGEEKTALETWQQAELIYRSFGDRIGIALTRINQAQAWRSLGFYRRSRLLLEEIAREIEGLPDSSIKVKNLYNLGITLNSIGDRVQSQKVLNRALEIARQLNSTSDIADIFLQLGNNAKSGEDLELALQAYQRAIETTDRPQIQLKAKLNQLNLQVELQATDKARALIPEIQNLLLKIPLSRTNINARINLADSLMRLDWNTREISHILSIAWQQAKEFEDLQAESNVVGQLGHLYERNVQLTEAIALSKKALNLAIQVEADEIAVKWRWQLGRLFKTQGDGKTAIAYYQEAVKNLKSLRQDLVGINTEVQFSFRDRVEPVYRELVELLLIDNNNLPAEIAQERLQSARQTIEALQIAELENFLGETCLGDRPQDIDKIDPQAAVIYPIFLKNKLVTIVSLPKQPLKSYQINLSEQERLTAFNELRQALNSALPASEILLPAQQIYNWLIAPIAPNLEQEGVQTLVFVLDGFLRNLPMSVLHDGRQYLLEKYNIVLNPGLELLPSTILKEKSLKVLTAGLSQSRQGFSALPEVETEIEAIQKFLPAKVILNRSFTLDNFELELNKENFSLLHIATHGNFSSKAEDTYLLTWEGRLNIQDLAYLLKEKSYREAIELLILSACQTAKGDNRSALGLAGIAIKSGARSTIASLWSVEDRSTSILMQEFYRLLSQKKMNKAETLRRAQLHLLKSLEYEHPFYWSSFVLIGNWK